MEGSSSAGVLDHLSMLEMQARKRTAPQSQNNVGNLKSTLEALIVQRDQLKAEIQANTSLQKLRTLMDKDGTFEREEDVDSEHSQLLQMMARHAQLKDLLHAHHLIGGYDITPTHQGKGVSVSLATAYCGLYLETYNLEMSLRPTLVITHHNIPPFIPLKKLMEQGNMQTDVRAFLDLLSLHLNAFAGRREQLKLIKENHKSVEVMESNALCSLLVVLFTVPGAKASAVLCTLDYSDHTSCLPTQVNFESEDVELQDSQQWKKTREQLLETPVHTVLATMQKTGTIV